MTAESAAREAIAYVREHYDESIFPPRPDGPHSEVYDGEAAAVARLTCDNILREFMERVREQVDLPRCVAESSTGCQCIEPAGHLGLHAANTFRSYRAILWNDG